MCHTSLGSSKPATNVGASHHMHCLSHCLRGGSLWVIKRLGRAFLSLTEESRQALWVEWRMGVKQLSIQGVACLRACPQFSTGAQEPDSVLGDTEGCKLLPRTQILKPSWETGAGLYHFYLHEEEKNHNSLNRESKHAMPQPFFLRRELVFYGGRISYANLPRVTQLQSEELYIIFKKSKRNLFQLWPLFLPSWVSVLRLTTV